ncbi:hypothetical protein ALC57_14360 [Trachymyrmex cornetzi]|uniref:Uncharacterized protein n=1 Tax=Trachymyrmex cornetzi TaxID=471704 RepID=A0A195DKI2_9HYME|nr:hypothetical protein ALC57_14360 [Trachymyrmex cornetzi]
MPSRRRWRRRDEERYQDVAWERRERMLATPLIADSLIGRGTAGGRKIIKLLPTLKSLTMVEVIHPTYVNEERNFKARTTSRPCMFHNFDRVITRDLRRHRESRVLKISSSDVNTGYRLTREGGLMSEVERTRALTQPRRTICCDQSRSRASSLHAS